MKEGKNIYEVLSGVNVNEHTDKKGKLTYLSWAWAWAEVKKIYPNANYEIVSFEGKPYLADEDLGYMVMTNVTIGDLTHEMWLFVMDGANKAMKSKSYVYFTKEKKWDNAKKRYVATGKMLEHTVEQASMFDINKTIMRCLVKNIGMFGLGLYIYAGEDLPEVEEDKSPPKKSPSKSKAIPPKKTPLKKVVENNPANIGDEMELSETKGIIQANIGKLHNAGHRDFATKEKCQIFIKSHLSKKLSECDLTDISFLRQTKGLIEVIMKQAKVK